MTEINLSNLAFNLSSVKEFVGQNKLYMAVVKADAYGHGAAECALTLENAGVDWFGVAIPSEGIHLRENGVKKPILCLGGYWAGQERYLIEHRITPVLYDLKHAELLDRASKEDGVVTAIHVKIDTGMGRVGVPFEEVSKFVAGLVKFSHLRLEGLMTHFAAADDLSQNEFTKEQITKFNIAVSIFRKHGFNPVICDIANSPGAIAHPESRADLVRLGGVLYGLGDDVLPQEIDLPELKPVLSLFSEIALIKSVPKGRTLGYGRTFETQRESTIATVPIGYQDGYMRRFSNRAKAIVLGTEVPVVGRVSMDWTLLDVTDVEAAAEGDRVTLIGSDGRFEITAAALAHCAGTISYEVTCGLDQRIDRVFIDRAS
jgi:alanine racemase